MLSTIPLANCSKTLWNTSALTLVRNHWVQAYFLDSYVFSQFWECERLILNTQHFKAEGWFLSWFVFITSDES